MPYVMFLAVCAIWGGNFLLMKKAAQSFSPLQIGTGRVLGGALVLVLIWLWQSRRIALQRRDWGPLLGVILIGNAFPYVLQPYLVKTYGSAMIAMTVSFVPLLTVILSVPFLGQVPTTRQIFGILGALCGLGLMLLEGLRRNVHINDILLAGTIPLGYAISNISIRRRLPHVPALELSWICLGISGVLLVPLLAWEPPVPQTVVANESVPHTLPTNLIPESISAVDANWWYALGCILALGMVGTGLANWMFNQLIRQQGPLFAGMVTNLVPLGAVLWGWLDGEYITPLQVAAVLIVMSMVALVQFGAAKSPAEQDIQQNKGQ